MKEFPIPPFGKHICHHSNGIKLHHVQKSAGSAVGDISIHQGDQADVEFLREGSEQSRYMPVNLLGGHFLCCPPQAEK